MNGLILAMSTMSFVTSLGTLVIMAKTAKNLNDTQARLKGEIGEFKDKTDRNVKIIRSAVRDLEF